MPLKTTKWRFILYDRLRSAIVVTTLRFIIWIRANRDNNDDRTETNRDDVGLYRRRRQRQDQDRTDDRSPLGPVDGVDGRHVSGVFLRRIIVQKLGGKYVKPTPVGGHLYVGISLIITTKHRMLDTFSSAYDHRNRAMASDHRFTTKWRFFSRDYVH